MVTTGPTVTDYLEEMKKAKRSMLTVDRRLRQAYDAAQESTKVGNYDDLEKLADPAARRLFKDTLVRNLLSPLEAAVAVMPEDANIASELLLGGFYGVTEAQVDMFVDQAKEGTSFETFWKWLTNPKGGASYLQAQSAREASPLALLDKISAEAVASHVGLTVAGSVTLPPGADTSRVITKPEKMTLRHKSELLDMFDNSGVVAPKYLRDQPYM